MSSPMYTTPIENAFQGVRECERYEICWREADEALQEAALAEREGNVLYCGEQYQAAHARYIDAIWHDSGGHLSGDYTFLTALLNATRGSARYGNHDGERRRDLELQADKIDRRIKNLLPTEAVADDRQAESQDRQARRPRLIRAQVGGVAVGSRGLMAA